MHEVSSKAEAERVIAGWIGADPTIQRVVHVVSKAFPSARSVLIVGGALRDCIMSAAAPKDLDFIVDAPPGAFPPRMPEAVLRKNFFGGLTFQEVGRSVDVWPLGETYHILKFGLMPSIENFLAGAPFNLDKAAFDVRTGELFEEGFLRGIRDKEIAYRPRNPYLEHVQAVRCVLLRRKTGFDLHSSSTALLARAAAAFGTSDRLVAEAHEFLIQSQHMVDGAARRDVIGEITRTARLAHSSWPGSAAIG